MDDEALLKPFLDKLKSSGTQSLDVEYEGFHIKVEKLIKDDMSAEKTEDKVSE